MSHLKLEEQVRPLSSPLVPLLPPKPSSRPLPSLILRSTTDSPFGTNHPAWCCTTFIVPAAFPRSIKGSTAPIGSAPTRNIGLPQKVVLADALHKLFAPQSEAMKSEVNVNKVEEYQDQEQLFLAVNRYSRLGSRQPGPREPGLTLVLSHANGFHKGALVIQHLCGGANECSIRTTRNLGAHGHGATRHARRSRCPKDATD